MLAGCEEVLLPGVQLCSNNGRPGYLAGQQVGFHTPPC